MAAGAAAGAAPAAAFPVGLDLARTTVNGRPVLGRTLAQVTQTFGRPDAYYRDGALAYVRYGSPRTFSLLVLFRSHLSVSAAFQDASLVEVRTGRLLTLPPRTMQRALRIRYGGLFRLKQRYACRGGGDCAGILVPRRRGAPTIRFGLAGGVQPFVSVFRTP